MNTPTSITSHAAKYVDRSWENYSIEELGNWVHLFTKRSYHRTDAAKRQKDLDDAQNYLNMIQSHIDEARTYIGRAGDLK